MKKGANVNDTNITPLHACVGNPGKDQKRVRYLIENGANINQVFGDYTPMQRAVLGRRLDFGGIYCGIMEQIHYISVKKEIAWHIWCKI